MGEDICRTFASLVSVIITSSINGVGAPPIPHGRPPPFQIPLSAFLPISSSKAHSLYASPHAYGAHPSSYGAPSSTYGGAPPSTYGAPSSYRAPPASYGASPTFSYYGAPPTYGT